MTPKQLAELKKNEIVRKRLAKLLALTCFRNTMLEDFHAGITPLSASGDYSDVKVVSPFGEIPWEKLSRLSDDEMKILMIQVVHYSYNFLTNLFVSGTAGLLIEHLKKHDPEPRWNDPARKPARPRRRSRIAGAAGQD
ncbi:MAG TPA: hypothetical protein VKT76_01950 [Bradyrhizobium sp.]|nr:hypothetical protein [Bradyrhizobium sp.]